MKENRENPIDELKIDFLSKHLRYRCKHATLRNELLAKALGCHPREGCTIIDATAGLGRDSFILASLGFNMVLLERSPILYQQLANAMEVAKRDPAVSPIMARMRLFHADAIEWLRNLPYDLQPAVIYLDPMFPERKKAASVKKEMVILQQLLGKCDDYTDLLNIALACAKKRVVVKRPRLAAKISERAANYSLLGKSCRFDIYLTSN